jgi:hypothetical protein
LKEENSKDIRKREEIIKEKWKENNVCQRRGRIKA